MADERSKTEAERIVGEWWRANCTGTKSDCRKLYEKFVVPRIERQHETEGMSEQDIAVLDYIRNVEGMQKYVTEIGKAIRDFRKAKESGATEQIDACDDYIVMKTCLYCRKSFRTSDNRKKYCTETCKNSAKQKRWRAKKSTKYIP